MEEKNKILFCPNCGQKQEENNKFCDSCGFNLDDTDKKEEKMDDFLENKEVIPTTNKKNTSRYNNSKFIIAIICSLVSIVFCIITIFICINVSSKTTETVKKDVTITDDGIAEAVNKVYDSVVVVKTYVKDQLYATGTGFVFKTDGNKAYILTNNHVIEGGSTIKVVFTNKKEESVEIVGSDSYSDIAVLSISKDKTISVAELGSTDDIRVGDTTFAVGAPLDSNVYSWTVTRGILSGKNRLVEVAPSSSTSSYVMDVLQTDTAINSGNSGGPLCNSNGEVIGITNMKISSDSVEGMGFAIPIETATEYADKFIKKEPITRPYLGISMYDLQNSYFASSTGIYVEAVESGSPADEAGLKHGDIITKINDVEVESSSYLKYELYKYNIGDTISITYTRNNKENTAKVKLGSTDSKS